MKQVLWTSPALASLEGIQDHLAERNPAAASRLANDILDRTDNLLSANPELGRTGRISGTRELVLSDTSYIVAYRVKKAVEIWPSCMPRANGQRPSTSR